jgi:hypothetical protein
MLLNKALNINVILMTEFTALSKSSVIDFIFCEWESIKLSSEWVPVTYHISADVLVDTTA